jgi:uncharacterized membrane protein
MSTAMATILAAAVATYCTRAGGHFVLSRMKRVPPKVEAALDAVPAAVLTTLVAPSIIGAGPAEYAALAVTGLVALRGGMLSLFIAGAVVLVSMRAMGL